VSTRCERNAGFGCVRARAAHPRGTVPRTAQCPCRCLAPNGSASGALGPRQDGPFCGLLECRPHAGGGGAALTRRGRKRQDGAKDGVGEVRPNHSTAGHGVARVPSAAEYFFCPLSDAAWSCGLGPRSDVFSMSTLMRARDASVAELLISHGADVHFKNEIGCGLGPLVYCSRHGTAVSFGSVCVCSCRGSLTALMTASAAGSRDALHLDVAVVLLSYGADVDSKLTRDIPGSENTAGCDPESKGVVFALPPASVHLTIHAFQSYAPSCDVT
jgi:hypothetical protein